MQERTRHAETDICVAGVHIVDTTNRLISMTVDDKAVKDLLKALPKEAGRAAELALDKTAKDIRSAVVDEMRVVFKSPVAYTLRSLRVTPTQNHNMQASVWFKDPDRMGQHYLVPQVEGGPRKYKGFERAFSKTMFIPGDAARMTKAGNVSPGQIRQILSVLGKAERTAGYSANITRRSARRNKQQRDYVYISRRHGKLYPGIYQRFAKGSQGVRSGTYQANQRGSKRGRFASVVRARGLRPVMLVGKQQAPIKPLLPFYKIATKVYQKKFKKHFYREFDKILAA